MKLSWVEHSTPLARKTLLRGKRYGVWPPLPTACVGVLTRTRTGLQISAGKGDQ